MKTRKVGKIVSLLVAIVLVATIMIPAAGVLADDAGYTVVKTHGQLQSALKSASTDGAETKIRLEGDIYVPIVKFIKNEDTFGYNVVGYLNDVPESEAGKYNDDDGNYVINRSYYYTGKKYQRYEKYHTYDNTVLRILSGTNVTLDLNGYSIRLYNVDENGDYVNKDSWQSRGGNNDPNPNPETDKNNRDQFDCIASKGGMASVVTVMPNATFNLEDKTGKGSLSGGTGNVVEANDISASSKTYSYHINGTSGDIFYKAATTGIRHDGTPGNAGIKDPNYGLSKSGTYTNYNDVRIDYYDFGSKKASTVKGGGVYVMDGATFNMYGGNITENVSWITATKRDYMFDSNTDLTAQGGGVYVSNGATFNMYGGNISMNAAKAYNKEDTANNATAQGGGVYLATGSTMNFNGGHVDGNSTWSYSKFSTGGKTGYSEGGGICVAKDATLNMMGTESSENFSDYPTVKDNTSGGYLEGSNSYDSYMNVDGAGIMIYGTANLCRAVVAYNTFPQITSGDVKNDSTTITQIERDEKTMNAYYEDSYGCRGTHDWTTDHTKAMQDVDSGAKEYTKLYDEDDVATLGVRLCSSQVTTASTWRFGSGVSGGNATCVYTNGAGIYMARNYNATTAKFDASLNIGDRVWCYDNWDQTTNLTGTNTAFTSTHDDVCLPKDDVSMTVLQHIALAKPTTESKIGVSTLEARDKRVIAMAIADEDLDRSVWSGINEGYDPTITDCQFFYDNGNNDIGCSYIDDAGKFIPVIFEEKDITNGYLDNHNGKDVLGFGVQSDAYNETDSTYKTYVALNFNEANLHKYGKFPPTSGGVISGEWQDNFKGTEMWLKSGNTSYTIELPRPDYANYDVTLPAIAGANNSLVTTKDASGNDIERADLFFKGYQFYSPYGHFEGLFNFTNAALKGDSTKDNPLPGYTGHSFTTKDLFTWNDNKLHISVPSYTAMWYSASELKQARNDVSVPKAMILVDSQGEVYIRVASLVGGYVKNISWPDLQPTVHTAADGTELYFDKPAFVASSINATPTLEGGYKSNNKMGSNGTYDANLTKKLVCNATNTKTTLDSWDYIKGNINNDLWNNWIANGAYSTANVSGSNKYVGIMWTNIDTGVNINDVYTDYKNMVFSDYAKQVIYVTPCIEVLKGSASGEHYTYYYGESRAFSIEQLIKADVAAGGVAPAPTTQG